MPTTFNRAAVRWVRLVRAALHTSYAQPRRWTSPPDTTKVVRRAERPMAALLCGSEQRERQLQPSVAPGCTMLEFTTLVVPEPPWARHYRRIGIPTTAAAMPTTSDRAAVGLVRLVGAALHTSAGSPRRPGTDH
jgi:hypothetical protein